ncbi:WAP four-disulfide core domain protein 3-like [Liolophura sinensis]|uniref:WAP four-disulfide core domain protein 3-like n=1 Tax=Liolophura sinensis TaxID=3198878 RepID=UPI003158D2DE
MKLLVFIILTITGISVFAMDRMGVCPQSSGLAGICIFDPNVNCLEDSECAAGEKCCSEGCNKVCKRALGVQDHAGACPAPSGLVGICVFIPGYNCLSDSECRADQKCCSEGCGRVCKTAIR